VKAAWGKVFLAEDLELERRVALKVLPADVASDRERVARFIQEAKAASALNHPNIITIHEVGTIDNIRFIATEHIEGETLGGKIRDGSLTLPQILDICVQTSLALQTAHSRNIIHRDIKPDNIMVRYDGLVKVLDFGLAKLTQQKPFDSDSRSPTHVQSRSGTILGTVSYMSPEQARGRRSISAPIYLVSAVSSTKCSPAQKLLPVRRRAMLLLRSS
jgi:serine/threonine protein kinase